MVVTPSLKVTVPVGVAPEDVRIAVSVTGEPSAAGFADDDSAAVEVAEFMT